MARLIDADTIFNNELLLVSDQAYDAVHAVIERINNAPTVDAVPLEDYKSMERTVNKLTKAIADAEPVRHGHWIAHGKAFMGATIEACSECGELLCGYNKAYCPYCGAKMDEVEDGV